jgi:hypothetical protein
MDDQTESKPMGQVIRESIKTRGPFPTEDAATKLIYLAIRDFEKGVRMAGFYSATVRSSYRSVIQYRSGSHTLCCAARPLEAARAGQQPHHCSPRTQCRAKPRTEHPPTQPYCPPPYAEKHPRPPKPGPHAGLKLTRSRFSPEMV